MVDNLERIVWSATNPPKVRPQHINQFVDPVERARSRVYDVRDYGATGNGVTDDTAALQAAIDAANAGVGGIVFFPPGNYRCVGLVLKSGVVLMGQPKYRGGSASKYAVRLTQASAGIVIDTPNGSACDYSEINGLQIIGLGSAVAGNAIRFRDANFCSVKNVVIHGFADEGVLVDSTSIHCIFEDMYLTQCVMTRTRAAKTGAMDIAGTDHVFRTVAAGTSQSIEGTITSANLYCCAWVIRGAQCSFETCYGEISDVGFHLLVTTSSGNRFVNARADLNYGHGWEIEGGVNQFANCLGLSNGQAANDTYDNWRLTSNSGKNILTGCRAGHVSGNAAKYGFNDLVSSAANKNLYVNCISEGAITAQYLTVDSNGSAFFFPSGAQKTLTVNSATPDVTGYERFVTANTSSTTITNFTGGVQGQRLLILCNDSNTTIQTNGVTITLHHLSNLKLVSGRIYEFVKMGSLWREVFNGNELVSADSGNAAKTLIWRRDETTHVWNTPLTADRAVTLSTTGATSGARYRIVRTAAATGAFNLNVGTGPLKALAAGQWCDVEYDGSVWMLTAFGSL